MLEHVTTIDGLVYYRSPLLDRAAVPHAFSTRLGGISPAPFDSLNLGNPSGCDIQDDYDRIHDNYRILQRAIGIDDRQRVWMHQVHGGDVVTVTGQTESGAKADAMITRESSRLLAVRVADCVPVLLASRDGSTVAAVHAGWRGVIARVLPNTIRAMDVDPANLLVAIGPCIGFESFEVGYDVLNAFQESFGTEAPVRIESRGKGRADLKRALLLQLDEFHLFDDQIDTTDRCTYRDRDEFFSHRRDGGVTGRMAAIIGTSAE